MNWYAATAFASTVLSFTGCVTFTTLYAAWYPFWRSQAGLNLFLFTLGLGALDGAFVLIQTVHAPWVQVVALIVYTPQWVVIWWRVALLIHTKFSDGTTESDPDG